MDGASVFRLISLIPDRMPRTQSGSRFGAGAENARMVLLCKLLHWLGPLYAISKEDQQILGLRPAGARPPEAEIEEGDAPDDAEEPRSDTPGAGTQIAA